MKHYNLNFVVGIPTIPSFFPIFEIENKSKMWYITKNILVKINSTYIKIIL